MLDDIRYAFRQLWKNPGFALVAVATLALGIGAASAMFGLIQGVLLSPPPYAEPGRLVFLNPERTDGQPYDETPTVMEVQAWRQARTFDAPALYGWSFDFLVEANGSESVGGMIVTPNYFQMLGRQTPPRQHAHRGGRHAAEGAADRRRHRLRPLAPEIQ